MPVSLVQRWIALGLILCAECCAQDIGLSPLRWSDPRDPPDELPVIRGGKPTDFPAELRKSPEINYTYYDVVVDQKGKILILHPRASINTLLRPETIEQRWSFAAAKRDGKAVNSAFNFAVLYNPASAERSKPDATPRLLEISPGLRPRPKGSKPTDVIADEIIPVELSIDSRGNVAAIEDAPFEYREVIQIAAKNWRFAPARQAGQDVAAKIRLPVILVTPSVNPDGKMTQPPRATHQERPIYPTAMRLSGMRGEVIVDFIVDIEGRVRNAYVVRSLNPAFDDPAVEAVRRWRFEPARSEDRPIDAHMQVPIVFALDQGGRDPFQFDKKGDLSKLPEEFRYDTPPRVRGAARPVFPHAALVAKRTGKAVVRLLINEKGNVIDTSPGESSAPEFGWALAAAAEHFVFEPALKAGRPCKALISFSQEFSTDELQGLVSSVDWSMFRREQKKADSIINLIEVDGGLKPRSQRPPKFPVSLLGKVENGQAVIEFLIDEDGRARLPRIVTATHDAFAYAAMQGIADWRFEPPRRGGRATVVRVRIPVNFSSPVPPGSGKAPGE